MGESGSVVLTSYDGKRLETVFVPLEVVGNNGTRSLPSAFLSTDGCGISEEFRKYAIPLIGEHNITKRAYLEPKFFSLKND